MGREIERKFLVRGDAWRQPERGELYRQGYLLAEDERIVRVRVVGRRAKLGVKARVDDLERLEFEYEIPLDDARELLERVCLRPLIEKTRYEIEHRGHLWEVDEFHGDNDGLVVAEIELEDREEGFERPPWVTDEVTHDPRYLNAHLVRHPYSSWGDG